MIFLEKPHNKLKGALVAKGVKVKDVAVLLDVTPATASNKLNRKNGADFKIAEAIKMCQEWGLDPNSIFFD